MADPAPSEDRSSSADKTAAGDARTPPAPAKVDGDAFTNTRKHVAEQQADDAAVERFANTKLNIALINDPKNGPRFTMTKREAGLAEDGGDDPADSSKNADETSGAKTPAAEAGKSSSSEAEKPNEPPAAANAAPSEAAAPQAAAPPIDEETPDKVQIDSTKIFVGHNGTYYDESWRWMDWRGTRQSWNWPAALSFGQWFAYRRLYSYAGLSILWLAGLAAAAVNNVPILALIPLALLGIGLAGLYGNTLYFFAFRRAVDHVTKTGEGDYEDLQSQLAAAGGTNPPAAGVMGGLTIAAIAAALSLTHSLRGGFSFNFWPF